MGAEIATIMGEMRGVKVETKLEAKQETKMKETKMKETKTMPEKVINKVTAAEETVEAAAQMEEKVVIIQATKPTTKPQVTIVVLDPQEEVKRKAAEDRLRKESEAAEEAYRRMKEKMDQYKEMTQELEKRILNSGDSSSGGGIEDLKKSLYVTREVKEEVDKELESVESELTQRLKLAEKDEKTTVERAEIKAAAEKAEKRAREQARLEAEKAKNILETSMFSLLGYLDNSNSKTTPKTPASSVFSGSSVSSGGFSASSSSSSLSPSFSRRSLEQDISELHGVFTKKTAAEKKVSELRTERKIRTSSIHSFQTSTKDLDKRLDSIFNALGEGEPGGVKPSSSSFSRLSADPEDPEKQPMKPSSSSPRQRQSKLLKMTTLGSTSSSKSSSFADDFLKRDGAGYSMDLPTLVPRAIRTGGNKN